MPASHPFSSRAGYFDSSNLLSDSSPSEIQNYTTNSNAPICPCKIRFISSSTQVKSRPTDLYLGSAIRDKQVFFWISWDENLYEESVIQEWLDEFEAAAEWYLGSEVAQL